ncbi:aminoglycoside adenylyltransferase domain-containing protein [Patescibacteria group bacterium]
MTGDKNKVDHKFWQTIEKDLHNLENVIVEKPAHGILTACQGLAHKRHGHKLKKHEAGEWGKKNLPRKFMNLIDDALVELAGTYEKIVWNTRELNTFVQYVLNELEIVGEV